MLKKLLWLLLFLAWAGTASAEISRVGATGAQFLKIGVGSKYQGMGDAAVAVANDVYSMYWNPAGLVCVEYSQVSFTNVNYVLDIDLNHFALAKYFEDVGVFGVTATMLSMDEQEITTFEEQDGTGDFYSAASYTVGVSYARQLTDRFAFGATAKYVGERIHKENAHGFAFDFGTLLFTGFRSLRLGMSISNMGPKMQFSGPDLEVSYDPLQGQGTNHAIGAAVKTTSYDLPMTFRVGLAYDLKFGSRSLMILAAEVTHPNDQSQQGSLGAQWGWDDKFFLRGGYKLNYDEQSLSLGGGLATPLSDNTTLHVDYAWQDYGRLDYTHRFSVGFSF